MNWNKLTSVEELDELEKQSFSKPVLIFKHSTRCSISAASLNRLERRWEDGEVDNLQAYYLDLIANRSVSDEIASRYQVIHQSPQVLLIRNGRSKYDNSHFGISFEEIANQLKLDSELTS